MTRQTISVIVPAYRAATTLADCLTALSQQSLPPDELIVIDDASPDETAVIAQQFVTQHSVDAQQFPIILIQMPQNQGAAAARNAGIAQATGDIICCTDADCIPTSDWLANLIRPLADPTIMAAKGIYATQQTSPVARFVQIEYEDKYDFMAAHMRQTGSIDFIDTYAATYRRQVLLDVGGFNEAMTYLEDQELSFRLAAKGHKMVFEPTAIVHHHHSDKVWHYARKKFVIAYWKAATIRRHPEKLRQDSHTPQIMKVQMILSMLFGASLVISVLFPLFFVITAVLFLLFLSTTIPFVQKAWPKDRQVAILSPILLLIRAVALSLGYMWGLIKKS